MTRPRYEVVSDEPGAFDFVTRFFSLNWSDGQKGIVLKRDSEIIAACLYVENNGTNCFVHLAGKAGKRWLTRNFLYWCFHYPFVQVGLKRMTGWIEATNEDSIRFAEHIGMTREATLKGAGQNGVDVHLYVITRENCRYV
jgi:RimJ/RimL family protein N-acetyltransferase